MYHYYLTSTCFPPDVLDDLREMVSDMNAGEYLAPPDMIEGMNWIHIENESGSTIQADIYTQDKNGLLELVARTTYPAHILDIDVARSIKRQLPKACEVVTRYI